MFCHCHDSAAEARARHREAWQRRGVAKAYGAMVVTDAPVAGRREVASLDLRTAGGVRDLLAVTLHALARLPLDVRTATAIGQLPTSQWALIESSDIEARLAALEARPGVRRAG